MHAHVFSQQFGPSMRTGAPQASRIVHRLGFFIQSFANSAALFAACNIERQIIISWKKHAGAAVEGCGLELSDQSMA